MAIRTRFSPSPTGMIHIGNARAALFAALFAAKQDGTFILRIEDTDLTRSSEQYVEALQEDLRWLGIDWQEGPGKDGTYGPYWQSQRQPIYQKYYKILEEAGHIYPCFCSDQELLLARKRQLSQGQAPRYAGTCKKLTPAEIESRLQEGRQPAWRFIVPTDETVSFTDVVKGAQLFKTQDIGDFIIRRADGTAPFLFCNAIDDALMQVSHVIRGEDHLTNTPRQLLLLKTLNLHTPQYGHLSLIVGDDGAPLSKRHGSFSVQNLREQGYLPLALINYLGRLGHACDNNDLLNFDDFAQHFDLSKLSRSPARFDLSQLKYWQKSSVLSLDRTELWRWLGESISATVPLAKRDVFAETIQANIEFPNDAQEWSKIFFHDHAPIDPVHEEMLSAAGEQYFVEAELAVEKYGTDLAAVFEDLKRTLQIQGKKLFMPLRVALTGRTHGPELKQIAVILGAKKMQHRLSRAFQLIAKKQA